MKRPGIALAVLAVAIVLAGGSGAQRAKTAPERSSQRGETGRHASTARDGSPKLAVTTDFPGGCAVVQGIDPRQQIIRIAPAPHKDRGWPCWWYIKVSGIRPGTVTVDVGEGLNGTWSRPDRAMFSTDGKTWKHTAPGKPVGDRTIYRQEIKTSVAQFAWGPPFVPRDAHELVERLAKSSPHAVAVELCKTREGRPVPALRVSQPGAADDERFGVWINARQHAWESGGSWVARGLAEWLVSDDRRAAALRRRSVITIVPVMDVDNVAVGAGGKNQQPHDHNRDWGERPHFAAVRAAMDHIARLDRDGGFDLYVDLHNPGPSNHQPFFYVTPRNLLTEQGRTNLDRFLAASQREITGPLKFSGETKPSGAGYDKRWKQISKNWVSLNSRGHVVAVTLETAWNTPHSTPEGYTTVGRQLGLVLELYFRRSPRK